MNGYVLKDKLELDHNDITMFFTYTPEDREKTKSGIFVFLVARVTD
jgi:hypothetical protein